MKEFAERKLPASLTSEISKPVAAAPEEQKEAVAARILEEVRSGKYDYTGNAMSSTENTEK